MRIIVLLFLLLSFTTSVSAQKSKIIVVIDPGHGGSDPGFLSENKNHLQEKDLNLLIAKKLGGYIETYLQNVTVVYTRTADTYPTLDERVAIANDNKADYFLSIHCNANDRKSVHGTESHVHSMTSKKAVDLAKEVEKEFSSRAGRHSRGVKDSDDREHSLQVLKFTQMTSVLIECGFLTNVSEANYLNTTNGQEILASAIFRAFRTTIKKEYPAISFVKSASSKGTTSTSGNYTIQIMSSKEWIDTESKSFLKLGHTVYRKQLNTTSAYKYVYTAGSFSSKEDANKALEKIKVTGFKDAFVVRKE